MYAFQIIKSLEAHYQRLNRFPTAPQWACFIELPSASGYMARYIDYFAFNCYPSNDFLRVAYEIKVSRSDFKRELQEPDKREPAMRASNEFYFICPKGMLRKEEMPAGCGLRDVSETGHIRTVLRAPLRKVEEPALHFIASIARRVAVVEKERRPLMMAASAGGTPTDATQF